MGMMAGGWRTAAAGAMQLVLRSASGAFSTSPSWSKSVPRSLTSPRLCARPRFSLGTASVVGDCGLSRAARHLGSTAECSQLRLDNYEGSWKLKTESLPDGRVVSEPAGPPRLAPSAARTVLHVFSPVAGPAWRALGEYMGWEEGRAKELIAFGGLYHKPHGRPHDAKPKRQLDPERTVEIGDYLRVYPMPRRYPRYAEVDWESTIVYETEGLMIANKPRGIPCHPTVDNYHENMLAGLAKTRPSHVLKLPHRLDRDTSGLVIVAKDRDTVGAVSKLMRAPGQLIQEKDGSPRVRRARAKALKKKMKADAKALRLGVVTGITNGHDPDPAEEDAATSPSKLTKRYRALVQVMPGSSPLSPSSLTHFVKNTPTAPKEFVKHRPPDEGGQIEKGAPTPWLECSLVVLAVRDARRTPEGAGVGDDGVLRLQEVEVELLTGRTHQIRGQLAAEGCPIYGDHMYGPRAVKWLGEVGVERGGIPEEAGTTGETEGALVAGLGASQGGRGCATDTDKESGMDDNSGAGEVAGSIMVGIGGVRESDWEGRFRRASVDSPCLALQAHEIVLEIGGEVHEWRLSRDTCWWFSSIDDNNGVARR